MSTDTLTVLTVLLAVVVVAVLAAALVMIRRGLDEISDGLGTLDSALRDVENHHLRPLEGAVKAINAQFDIILGALVSGVVAVLVALVSGGIGDALLVVLLLLLVQNLEGYILQPLLLGRSIKLHPLAVVLPIVLYLLSGVLDSARRIVPSVEGIAATAAAGSKDLDAVPLLLTTQSQVEQTVAGVADYGGSLDVIVDDAGPVR